MGINNFLLSYLMQKAAKAHGFLDPVNVLAQLSRFGQPADVMAPTELLRSGALLHARGLINSQAIQHNLDWIWPYWVVRQFNPRDKSFIPRAFQLTHINLTHRNWTAVGIPDKSFTPIVDPRGLVTPLWDGWSIDAWVIDKNKDALYPSKLESLEQVLECDDVLSVTTKSELNGKKIVSKAFVEEVDEGLVCRIDIDGFSDKKGWLVVSLRPFNPEGVSFINHIERLRNDEGWKVNRKNKIVFSERLKEYQLSDYRRGDVANNLFGCNNVYKIDCKVGMATAAALFELLPDQSRRISVKAYLSTEKKLKNKNSSQTKTISWSQVLDDICELDIPDKKFKKLYDTALTTVVLHTADQAYAGPYTYKRFWFRDAVFIAYALLSAGLKERAWKIINGFPKHLRASGYFCSQNGEWDSNGQVLWILKQYAEMTNSDLDLKWQEIIRKAGQWIVKKRLPQKSEFLNSGLLPAGFSAEHLGPNDYYYWDDFWSISGLEAAAYFMQKFKQPDLAKKFAEQAKSLKNSVEKSLSTVEKRLNSKAMPASPYRRMDSGAIGSLAAGYPLQVWENRDQRLLQTINYLVDNCMVNGGFFHDMSHSGINPYLTLHIAQVLLAAGDIKFYDLMKTIAELASPTGQWPEAIHPGTGGGCMGDGQHVWAAAEWIMMVRNCFLREDLQNNVLVLCSGVVPYWYVNQRKISFGPAPTSFGDVKVYITTQGTEIVVNWKGRWHDEAPNIEINLPGFEKLQISSSSDNQAVLKAKEA
jgi:hypothetical protein